MSSKNERAENEGSVKIDVDSTTGTKQRNPDQACVARLLSKITKDFKDRSVEPEEPIICRVPDYIKGNHLQEYEPKILAIGPYHRFTEGHGREIHPRLKPMEDIKLQFLTNLCDREANNRSITKEDALQIFTTIIQSQEINARKKYLGSIFQKMTSEDFVEMLVLDGCFIVELMLRITKTRAATISMTFHHNTYFAIIRDLLLFENQIPFFIVEKIFGTCSSTINGEPISTLVDYALFTVNWKITKEMLPNEYSREDNPEKIHHLLHLYHLSMVSAQNPLAKSNEVKVDLENCTTIFCNVIKTSFSCLVVFMIFILLIPVLLILGLLLLVRCCWNYLLGNNKEYETPMEAKLIPTATQLAEYGVQFRKKDISNAKNILDVSFKDGIMEIPNVDIIDDTSSMYRNLIALEQSCEKEYENKFTSYVFFMDDLIDTADDVALLRKNKILDNHLGSEEVVAKMFNEMCIELFVDLKKHHLVNMYKEINKYCDEIYNKWRATLMRDYFNSPWSIISVIAVSFLICLAVVQTVFSVIKV